MKNKCKKFEKGKKDQNYIVENDSETEFVLDDEVNINYVSSNILDKKVYASVKIDNQLVKFEIDSSSPITAILTAFFKKHFEAKHRLRGTDRDFKSYVGQEIIPVGLFNTNVMY